jgi:universal stress protein A
MKTRLQRPSQIGRVPTIRLQKILVLTDLSAGSLKALRYAVWFAKSFHGEIILLHVCEPSPCNVEFSFYQGQIEAAEKVKLAEAELSAVVSELRGQAITATPICSSGDTCQCIREALEMSEADLLIISTRGQFSLPDFCRRSATEEILAHAKCPVLVLREDERDFVKG